MWRILWRLSQGYRLDPWRSPYLRWRIETHWGTHAERISFRDFWKFAWRRRSDLLRYLRWAAQQEHLSSQRKISGASGKSPLI
jgi:hypothetical protein